jgi:hypothetical protein
MVRAGSGWFCNVQKLTSIGSKQFVRGSDFENEKPKTDTGALAEMGMIFFSGLSIEENLAAKASGNRRVETHLCRYCTQVCQGS